MASSSSSFRLEQRSSTLRINIFTIECVLLLGLYVAALHRWVEPGAQQSLLTLFGVMYLARLLVMARWLLPRELAMEELTFVMLIWLPSIFASFVYGCCSISGTTQWTACALYACGSWMNSCSELQRKCWKARPENKGRCYRYGLFALSRNINYLGDVVLFGGWAVLTGCWWNVWVPVVMAAAFQFHHIPDKEAYLAKRYAEDWPDYVANTKGFIPFVL